MSKSDLVASVAEKAGLTKADATKAVDAVFDAIQGALAKGDEVRIHGFGSFAVSARPARQGKNPRTGEAIELAASKQPKFSASKVLKDVLNG